MSGDRADLTWNQRMSMIPPRTRVASLALALLSLCAGCAEDDGSSNSFILRTASHGVDATATPVVVGGWMVYLADEASSGATDLNGDTDTADDVAVAVNLSSLQVSVLRAAVFAAIVNANVYLVVDEAADGTDWDPDPADNLVLLHWEPVTDTVTFVDQIDPGSLAGVPLVTQDDERVYYSTVAVPVGDDTTLRFLDRDAPTVPVVVQNQTGSGPLAPLLIGEDEGLLFLSLDETSAPAPPFDAPTDYNGDSDTADSAVLAVLDGTDETAQVLSTGLALAGLDAPFAAHRTGSLSEWLFATLVNETAQGATNLNDQTAFVNPLMPSSCAGTPDIDTDDDVLFYARYETLLTGTAPVNTGLAGRDRVVAVEDHVATLSDELDATCDMNEDGDSADTMVRWLEAVDLLVGPTAPPRDPSQLHAAFDVAGGSRGLVALGNRLVMVVDEAADSDDINGDTALDDTLIGHLDPADGALVTWTFSHPDTNPGTGITGENFAGVNWVGAEEAVGRLGMAFMEETLGFTINVDLGCAPEVKDSDAVDSLPVWADFSGSTLDFDGQGYALHETDPGIVITRDLVFYRVSESSDNIDYDGDGTMADVILFRNPQTFCSTVAMATASSLPGPTPAVITDGVVGGVFLADEFMHGSDLNGDADVFDLVPRYFIY